MIETPQLKDWQATLGGLLLGPGTPYEWMDELVGFDELPPIRSSDETRPAAHGDFSGTDFADGRSLEFSLEVAADAGVTFADALGALDRVLVPNPGPETVPFWYQLPGKPARRSEVKVRRRRTHIDRSYEAGLAVVDVQLRAPDPLLYGDMVIAGPTGHPALAGGLEFDLFTDGSGAATGFLEFGDTATTGRLTLSNPGTAAAWPVFAIAGPVPDTGFELVCTTTGRRLRFLGAIAADSVLTIDTSTGSALLDLVADRGGRLTIREWFSVPAGGSCEVLFTPLGPTTAATLTATYSPTFW